MKKDRVQVNSQTAAEADGAMEGTLRLAARTGLTPANPLTVPAIPELQPRALASVGILMLWLARRRRGAV